MIPGKYANKRQTWVARLAALLIAISALLPQGTMLARDAQSGLIEITICSGVSSRTVLLNPETGEYIDAAGPLTQAAEPEPVDHTDAEASLCPFAVAGDVLSQVPAGLCGFSNNPVSLQIGVSHPPAPSFIGAPFPPRGPPALT